jgi:hypothetical protein
MRRCCGPQFLFPTTPWQFSVCCCRCLFGHLWFPDFRTCLRLAIQLFGKLPFTVSWLERLSSARPRAHLLSLAHELHGDYSVEQFVAVFPKLAGLMISWLLAFLVIGHFTSDFFKGTSSGSNGFGGFLMRLL